MKQILIKAFLGSVFSLFGLGLFLYAIIPFNKKPDVIFIIISVVCAIIGVPLLISARKAHKVMEDNVLGRMPLKDPVRPPINLLQKQRQIFEEWKKVNLVRDKLKMLKIAAAAEEDAKKHVGD
jgi:hypothetical protein